MTKRILIVDDDPKVINILTQFFQMQHGHAYEITSAGNVRDALAILLREGFGFDLILLEVDMSWMGEPVRPPPPRSLPGSHGLDLLKEIRKRGMNVPVIMMCSISRVICARWTASWRTPSGPVVARLVVESQRAYTVDPRGPKGK